MHTAQVPRVITVWKIGTSTIEQVCDTNCPAALHTATASLILLKQHKNMTRKTAPNEIAIYPYISYSDWVTPSTEGML